MSAAASMAVTLGCQEAHNGLMARFDHPLLSKERCCHGPESFTVPVVVGLTLLLIKLRQRSSPLCATGSHDCRREAGLCNRRCSRPVSAASMAVILTLAAALKWMCPPIKVLRKSRLILEAAGQQA